MTFDKPVNKEEFSYTDKINHIEKYVSNEVFDYEKLINKLGNDVSAFNSVPAAIFSFAACAQTNYIPPGCESTENPFERSLHLGMVSNKMLYTPHGARGGPLGGYRDREGKILPKF